MLRGRGARAVLRRGRPQAGPVPDAARWERLFPAAAEGRRGAVEALLRELRATAAHGSAPDRRLAVERLLAAPPRLWPALDRAARAAGGTAAEPRRTEPAAHADPLALLLASFDADGRLRQAAVERFARRSGRCAAAALALRTDDWVPAVRERAVAALLEHTAPEEAAAAVRILTRLGGRDRAAGVLGTYRAALAEPERRRTVRRLAAEPDPGARRFGMELALELGEYVRGDLVRAALHDRDQVCRRMCAQRLLELDPDQAGRLMWARSAAVRELAVAALPDEVPAARLVAPLADRSRMVRAQARWKLYKRGRPPAEVYRGQLGRCGRGAHVRLVAGLATGLGECGDAGDLPLLASLVRDGSWAPAVRRAAVRALGRLAGPARGAELAGPLTALTADPDPSLAREALDALVAVGAARPAPVAAALRRPEPPVWRAALRATRALELWDRLELVLRAAGDPRPETAGRARAELPAALRAQWRTGPDADRSQLLWGLLHLAGLPRAEHDHVALVLRAAGTAQAAHGEPPVA